MTHRAQALFDQLSQRYLAFVDGLPDPIQQAARNRMTYSGDKGEGPFEGVGDLNPVLAKTPWHFWEQFESLDDARFVDIAEAGACTVVASILLDHLIDGHAHEQQSVTLLQQLLYARGARLYRSLFPRQSRFWVEFSRLSMEHLAGLSLEVNIQLNPRRVTYDELGRMAHGKVCPIVITQAALAEATQQQHVLEPIEASLKEIAVASQLLDDIGDWREDLTARHITFFLSQQADHQAWEASIWPAAEQIQRQINSEWSDVEHLAMVQAALGRSKDAARGLDCPGWIEYLEDYERLADQHATAATARHLGRTLRAVQDSWKGSAQAGDDPRSSQ